MLSISLLIIGWVSKNQISNFCDVCNRDLSKNNSKPPPCVNSHCSARMHNKCCLPPVNGARKRTLAMTSFATDDDDCAPPSVEPPLFQTPLTSSLPPQIPTDQACQILPPDQVYLSSASEIPQVTQTHVPPPVPLITPFSLASWFPIAQSQVSTNVTVPFIFLLLIFQNCFIILALPIEWEIMHIYCC